MRRLCALLVLAGLFLVLGCGQGDKVVAPDNVPPRPKGPLFNEAGPGGKPSSKSTNAPGIKP
jgi:hypothetical protein